MRIADGAPESHPALLPYDPGESPAVAGMTPTSAGFSGPAAGLEGGVRDLTGERLADLAAIEAACHAAQMTGMDARNAMLAHYQGQEQPLGGQIGDSMTLPEVPANTVPPAMSDLYPYGGMEPTPAAAGFPGKYGGG